MNPKIKKLKAEHEKNDRRIAACRARNAEIEKKVTELENLDIVGLVRGEGMTPDELADLIRTEGRKEKTENA